MNETIDRSIDPTLTVVHWVAGFARIRETACADNSIAFTPSDNKCGPTLRRRYRATAAGFAMLELIVAAGLLATAVSLVATCAVATQRIQRMQQQNTLAVDELSNQLERLTALPPSDVDSALQQLQPSTLATQRLPGSSLTGKRTDDEWGDRVELQLQWPRIGSPPPLVAVVWLRSESIPKDES